MRHSRVLSTILLVLSAACGRGDRASESAPEAPPAPMEMPADWIVTDAAARTVTLEVVAGRSDANGGWNFNGYANGAATVVVPEGFAVTIRFSNADAKAAHSIGVVSKAESIPVVLDPTPAFAGAISDDAASGATAGGATQSITFTPSPAGDYVLASFVPGQAAGGMWIGLRVVAGAASATLEMLM